ncbi:MAG: T9SS type A sorting domain-containing protein [Saprospiraceae bacterium]
MYNKTITILLLSLLFSLSSFAQCIHISGGLYCTNINDQNFDTLTIKTYFEETNYFSSTSEQAAAMANIISRMNLLFTEADLVEVDAGKLVRTGNDNVDGNIQIDLRWTIPIPNALYFSGYMDLLSGEIFPLEDPISTEPGVRFSVPETTRGNLFTLNVRHNDGQGSYDIIIVDRDINFSRLDPRGNSYIGDLGNNHQFRGEFQNKIDPFSQLKLVPNPVDDSNFQIKFHLSENKNTSINLFHASSGKLVKTILSNQHLTKGDYSLLVENELIAGAYFIVFQTGTKKRVEKLIKID